MNYLKQKLEEKHISQKELALRCNVLPSTISRYCNDKNKKPMSIDLAYNIAMVLDMLLDEFVKGIIKEIENDRKQK